MPATEIVRARIDSQLKQQATTVLSDMGLSMSDAIRLLLVRIAAEKALPFEVRTPNAETQAALYDARSGRVTRVDTLAALTTELESAD